MIPSDEVVVCRACGQAWTGARVGDRCPNQDGALIDEASHQAWPNDPILGRVIADKYPVVGVLGEGGFGAVYLALQEPVGRQVALKIIAADEDHPDLPPAGYPTANGC